MIRFFGVCGIAGGVLRLVDSFTAGMEGRDAIQLLYIATDLGLILGLLGLYLVYRDRLSAAGHAGFVLALCGFSVIAGPDAAIFGMGIYWIGAPVIGLGMLLLSFSQLGAEPRNRLGPWSIIASVLIGFCSLPLDNRWLFLISGLLFGLGFIINGYFVARGNQAQSGLG